MKTVQIKTQKEWDELPKAFEIETTIEIVSDQNISIIINKTPENSYVEAYNSARVVARGSARVEARGSASVVARDLARVEAYGSARVEAYNLSSVEASGLASVVALDSARVEAYGSARVEAWGSASVVARDSARVVARDSARVEAYEFVTLLLFDCAWIRLFDYVVCRRKKNSQVHEINGSNVIIIDDFNATPISFETWLERGYVFADGIHAKLVSRKTINDIEVFTVRKSILDDNDSFVVKRGDKFSHGETVEKAIQDLRYKISDRDTSKFKDWNKNTVIPIEDAIEAYRVITGACEFGVKDFVEHQKEIPEKISIGEVIARTKGVYGNQEFSGFFK